MHAITHPPAGLYGVAFLQAMRRALPHLLLATIVAGLATYVAQSWASPRYLAEARISVSGADPAAAVATHIRALDDRARLLSVASELGLRSRPELERQGGGQALLEQLGARHFWERHDADEALLAAVYERLTVVAGNREGEIAVRFASVDPELAAQFVNRLVELHVAGKVSSARNSGIARVAAWAEVPETAEVRRKGPVAMLGMAMMLLAGLGAIALREAFRTTSWAPPRAPASTGRIPEDHQGGGQAFGRPCTPFAAADRFLALPAMGRGCRIMVAGEATDIDAGAEACTLADRLSATDRKVVLVRWALGGGGIDGRKAGQRIAGINDLLEGRATFEEIVMRLPGSSAHAIAAGSLVRNADAAFDPDLVSLVLDTLDEVYDYIVVVAEHEEAVALFAALEGRFDACVSVGESGRPANRFTAGFDRFLGFEVVDIDIVRIEREREAIREDVAMPALQARLA